ncbi:MAG: hypothetical protein K0S32_3386 [Bacteroidetes bacterium]|nr:hypothetical protein [Bacteroidota bacterium]
MKKHNIQLFVRLLFQTVLVSCCSVSDRIEGKWNITDIIVEGESVYNNSSGIDLDSILNGAAQKKNGFIIFNKDNTFEMKTPADLVSGRWSDNDEEINLKTKTGDSLLMKVVWKSSNNIELILQNCPEKIKMVLKK